MCDTEAGSLIQLLGDAASHGFQRRGPCPGISRVCHQLGRPPTSPPHPPTQQDEKDSLHSVAVERPCTIKVMVVTPLSTEINPELFEGVHKLIRRGDFLLHSQLICL
jgi:hypothetical protein